MSHIKSIIRIFIYVTAANTIGSAIFLTFFDREVQFSYILLWQFIGIAAICALGNLIFWSNQELSKRQMNVRNVLHYLYTNFIVIGGAFVLKWIEPDQIRNIAFLIILVAVIYGYSFIIMFKSDEKTAEDVNKKLRKYNDNED